MQAGFPKKAVHGGRIIELRKLSERDYLDVSASMNPYPPAVSFTPENVDFSIYPDDSYDSLRKTIARVFHRSSDEVCVGNGSVELIRVYCQVLLPRKTYFVHVPTFSEYALSAELAHGRPAAKSSSADVQFICNPNNPTGELKPREEILALADNAHHLFVDEAFMELAARDESVADVSRENMFVLRSLTKSFAIPGIRFGFGLGPADLIEKMETVRPPWSVNAFAEAFAVEAFKKYDKLKQSAEMISREREWYFGELTRLGLTYASSEVNFILIHLPCRASDFSARMSNKGILVRDCTSFGLENCIRVSIESHDKNKEVMEAIEECLH